MSFSDLLNNTIDIHKQDGTVVKGVKAAVTKNRIIVLGNEILIKSGDQIISHLSNGDVENYEVIDPCFNEGLKGIPASYQMVVKKIGIPNLEKQVFHNTFNIHGSQNRINQNSNDHSVNIVNSADTEISKLVEELKNLIVLDRNIGELEKNDFLEIISTIDEQARMDKPNKTVLKSLISALPKVERVTDVATKLMSIVTSIVSLQ